MGWVAGVDGTRSGWVAVLWRPGDRRVRVRALPRLADLLALEETPAPVALDMPIGLPETAEPGGRLCDQLARARLGRRAACVFSPPARPALAATDHAAACRRNRAAGSHRIGLSRQAFHLFPKLREVDALMTPALQGRVREAHPELAFARLNGGLPVTAAKRSAEGRRRRAALLAGAGLGTAVDAAAQSRTYGAAPDDVLDAAALAWLAARMTAGQAERLPAVPPRDGRGLLMEIWG